MVRVRSSVIRNGCRKNISIRRLRIADKIVSVDGYGLENAVNESTRIIEP